MFGIDQEYADLAMVAMRAGLMLMLLVATVAAAHAEQITAKVVVVFDGDTVMVVRSGKPPAKVRLAEIDAPERAQQGGEDSKNSLSELVLHKQVHISTLGVDSYGRMLANIEVDGMNVNEEQVRRGMAWEYSYFHSNRIYIALQNYAQQTKRGLWAGDEIMKPALWRKLHAIGAPSTAKHALSSTQKDESTCGNKRYCSQMHSCEEAYFYLSRCGVKSLDMNRDGVPCENLCSNRK